MKDRAELLQLARTAGVLHVKRTALNPILWLLAVALAAFVIAGSLAGWNTRAGYLFLVLIAVVVIAALAVYFILLFRDPDRLQSEEYQLQVKQLQAIVSKEGSQLDPDTLESLPNPLSGTDQGDRER